MNFRVKKYRLVFVIQSILLFFCSASYLKFHLSVPESISNWSTISVTILFILIVFQLIWMIKFNVRISDFEFWFMILSYLFMFGRVILNAFKMDGDIFWNLMVRYENIILFQSSVFILLSLQAIFFSLMLMRKEGESTKTIGNNKLTYSVGIVMFVFTAPFKLMEDFYNIRNAQAIGGYAGLTGRVGLIDDIAFLAIPSIILILASKKFSRKKINIIITLTVAYLVFLMAISGDRRYSVTGLIALLLCYLRTYEIKIDFKKMLLLSYLVMIFLNLFIVVREVRVDNLTSISSFIVENTGRILFGTGFFVQTMEEFGLTFFSVVHIFQYIPTLFPFQQGLPLLYTIPSFLPVGWLFGDMFSKTSISAMTNGVLNVPVGSSLFGELYGNFSWYGLIGVLISGVVLAKVMNSKLNTNYDIGIYYCKFYILINLVRAEIFEVYRPLVMVIVVPYVIMQILNYYFKSKDPNYKYQDRLQS